MLRRIILKASDDDMINSEIDAKEGIAVMAMINKTREKLYIWVLATGTTEKYKKYFKKIK